MGNFRRRITILLSLLALAGVLVVVNGMPAAGQSVAVEPPLATSSNVHFLGHIPGTAAGMNFKDHYAYVTGWTGVTVLDIRESA